jgi:hypothetical protein
MEEEEVKVGQTWIKVKLPPGESTFPIGQRIKIEGIYPFRDEIKVSWRERGEYRCDYFILEGFGYTYWERLPE